MSSHRHCCCRFFVNNNFLQDVGSKPLVYPDPPPTLRDVLPPIQGKYVRPHSCSAASLAQVVTNWWSVFCVCKVDCCSDLLET